MIGVARRRVMGRGEPEQILFSTTVNPEMLAVCYSKGWAAHSDYMTYSEAAAVTSIGTAFNYNTSVIYFDLSAFTSLTSIPNGCTYGMTACTSVELPTSVATVGNNFMNNGIIQVGIINEGCTKVGNTPFQNSNLKLIVFPSTISNACYISKGTNSSLPHFDLIFKATTPVSHTIGGIYLVDHIYVPDDSIEAYQSAMSSASSKILGKSSLPSEYQQYWP